MLSSQAFSADICSQNNMDQLVAAGLEGLEDKRLAADIQKAQVAIIGEIHFETSLQPRLDVIKAFRNLHPGVVCAAFEFPVRDYSFTETLVRFGQMKNDIVSLKNLTPEQQEGVKGIDTLLNYYGPMEKYARDLGMRTVTVDHFDNYTKDLTIDERNEAMATNIDRLLKAKQCDSVIFFVGKAHLAKNYDSKTRVQDLVRAKGVAVTSVNLQMTSQELNLTNMNYRSWSVCRRLAKVQLNSYIALRGAELIQDAYLFPYLQNDQIHWSDFDWTLLAP